MIKNILIICMGNICRSPIAEGLLKYQLSESYPEIQISSAGITAMVNHPADLCAQQLMKEKKNVDISLHRARQITIEIALQSDLILVMELEHQKQLEYRFPVVCGRVHRLGKWGGFDIPDPYKRSIQVFEHTLSLIEQGVQDWHKRLWK